MAHSNYLHQMARLLRVEQQLTVDQLARRLALPRSTVYYWVRDLPLRGAASGGEAGEGERAGRAGDVCRGQVARGSHGGVVAGGILAEGTPAKAKPKRSRASSDAAYEEALRSFDDLAAQPTFGDFVCVYIMRGCTRERTKVSLSDSDPAVIRLVNRWLLRLTDKSPLLSLRYEPGQSLTELRRFWGAIVGVQPRTIRVHDEAAGEAASAAPYEAGRGPRHGMLTVAVEDALLRARLQAWMRKTRDSWR